MMSHTLVLGLRTSTFSGGGGGEGHDSALSSSLAAGSLTQLMFHEANQVP